ncbi:ankyrin repeat domain-containing protein 24-like [Scleropages formosus]|uniref:Ankyrin repeat domain-containing protein 24-like n=1 Tax=Scleropages formosus TaxID=113540 RepID=A0A0P7Z0M0_SCLFO|nr:ankyrin repeat domain-containing protein 24-like [Scleropages formosus]
MIKCRLASICNPQHFSVLLIYHPLMHTGAPLWVDEALLPVFWGTCGMWVAANSPPGQIPHILGGPLNLHWQALAGRFCWGPDTHVSAHPQGLDWNKSDERLLQAVEQNDPDKVAALLVKKRLCASKLDSDGKSAFHMSVSRGRVDCLEVFLSHGVDMSSTDGSGLSALHLAAKNGHPMCVRRLLQGSGQCVSSRTFMSYWLGSDVGDLEDAGGNLYLSAQEGAPVDSTDSLGRTALHHAVSPDRRSATTNPSPMSGSPAAHGCLSCTEILGDFSTCLDTQDTDGVTPLLLAAQTGRAAICDLLLTQGADVNLRDSWGRSALMLACEMNSVDTVQALMRGGAKPHSANEGQLCTLPGPVLKSVVLCDTEEMYQMGMGRAPLLRRKNDLEQEQHSAPSALEELCALEEQLKQVEMERNRLLLAIQDLQEAKRMGMEEELNPLAPEALTPRSCDSEHDFLSAQEDCMSQGDADSLCTPLSQRKTLAGWALLGNMDVQSDMVLKAQSDTESVDMQSTCSLLVPIALYDSLKKESEGRQEPACKAQGAAETSCGKEDDGCVDILEQEQGEGTGGEGPLKERLQELEQELTKALEELEELRGRAQVGVMDKEAPVEDGNQEVQQRGEHMQKQEEQVEVMTTGEKPDQEGAGRSDADADGVWSEKAEEVMTELEGNVENNLLAEQEQGGEWDRDPAPSLRAEESIQQGVLQDRLVSVEMELEPSTPGLQLEQLAQERAEVAARLAEALRELKRMRPLPELSGEEEEEDTHLCFRLDCSSQTSRASSGGDTVQPYYWSVEQRGAQMCQCEKQGSLDVVPVSQHQEALVTFNHQLSKAARELQEEKALRWQAEQKILRLQADLQTIQQDMISRQEHETVKLALQRSLEESETRAQEALQALGDAQQGALSRENHEAQCNALRTQIGSFSARLAALSHKHQDTCFELLRVQREALFNKMARQAVEAQLSTARRHLADLKVQSCCRAVGVVKGESRIAELSKEVFLKEALETPLPLLGLPSSESSSQQVALKSGVAMLTRQLQDWEQKHRAVVSVYRAHLLAAVQGRMDEEVQTLLLQILRMTQTDPSY